MAKKLDKQVRVSADNERETRRLTEALDILNGTSSTRHRLTITKLLEMTHEAGLRIRQHLLLPKKDWVGMEVTLYEDLPAASAGDPSEKFTQVWVNFTQVTVLRRPSGWFLIGGKQNTGFWGKKFKCLPSLTPEQAHKALHAFTDQFTVKGYAPNDYLTLMNL